MQVRLTQYRYKSLASTVTIEVLAKDGSNYATIKLVLSVSKDFLGILIK